MRVLITGAAGWTAAAILDTVRATGHEVAAFDLPEAIRCPGLAAVAHSVVAGDVASLADVAAAMQGADAVIHLAIAAGADAYETPDIPFAVNVKGTYNVFEAARRHAIGKIVLMSEAAVHVPFGSGEPLRAVSDWRSSAGEDHLYDLTKRLQEEIARDFCETHGMNAVVLRAGHIVDGRTRLDPHGRRLTSLAYARGGWVCRYDLARACALALDFAHPGYAAFHVVGSRAARGRFDVARTERELGLCCETEFGEYGN